MKIVVVLEAQEKIDMAMEKKLKEIIKDYDECKISCSECKADQKIEGFDETTWCDFLLKYTQSILDKIENAIF